MLDLYGIAPSVNLLRMIRIGKSPIFQELNAHTGYLPVKFDKIATTSACVKGRIARNAIALGTRTHADARRSLQAMPTEPASVCVQRTGQSKSSGRAGATEVAMLWPGGDSHELPGAARHSFEQRQLALSLMRFLYGSVPMLEPGAGFPD